MRGRVTAFIWILAWIILLLPGCGVPGGASPSSSDVSLPPPPSDPTPFPVTVGELTLETSPDRIVSLSPALTAILVDLGYDRTLVGRSSHDEASEAVAALADCGTPLTPDVEAILALSPDLLISQAALPDLARRALARAEVQILILPAFTSLSGMRDIYTQLATAMEGGLAGSAIGDDAAASFERAVREIADLLGTDPPPLILLTDMAPAAATPDTFEGELLTLAGFQNAATGTGYRITVDELAQIDPYFLVVPHPVTIPDLEKMKDYKGLDSVLYDRVLAIDPTALESGGEAAIRCLREIAGVVAGK